MGAVNAPWMTARTSRGGGRKVFAAFITQSLTGLAGFDPNGRHGGRKRQRPLTAPRAFSGPGSTLIVPKSRSLVAPVIGLKSIP